MTIQRIIQILSAISCRFNDDHPFRGCVSDCLEVIRPPLNGDIALLIISELVIVSGTRTVHLQQNNVPRSAAVCSGLNCRG